MSPLEYLRSNGDAECAAVAQRAGTTLAYFKQIAYGFRRPSPELARKLQDVTAGDLNAVEMAFADTRTSASQEDRGHERVA